MQRGGGFSCLPLRAHLHPLKAGKEVGQGRIPPHCYLLSCHGIPGSHQHMESQECPLEGGLLAPLGDRSHPHRSLKVRDQMTVRVMKTAPRCVILRLMGPYLLCDSRGSLGRLASECETQQRSFLGQLWAPQVHLLVALGQC